MGGFTLIELITVVIILGALAALAVPKFIDLGRQARIATVQALAGALQTTANNVYAMCATSPDCDYGNWAQNITIAGKAAAVCYGWLDSGDHLGWNQIDTWVTYDGFTASLPSTANTLFTLDGSPDPVNCSVNYFDAFHRGATAGIDIVVTTSGC